MLKRFLFLAVPWLMILILNAHGTLLRDELQKFGIDDSNAGLPDLDQAITGFAVLNNDDVFFIAYYRDKGEPYLESILRLELLNKSNKTWIHQDLDLEKIREQCDCPAGGSILDIRATPGFFYLNAHHNPSSCVLMVLNRDLKFHDGFFSLGNFLAQFSDETVLYQNHQVHFAPWPHPMTLSLYFPQRREHRPIYPMKPFQAVRSRQIELVRAEYQRRGDAWFGSHHHNWNAEEFGERLDSTSIVVNNDAHSLIFIVYFSNMGTWKPGWDLSHEYMSDTRLALKETKGPDISDAAIDAFCRNMQAVGQDDSVREDFLSLFDEDPQLKDMVRRICEIQFDPKESWRTRLLKEDLRWGDSGTWAKLIRYAVEYPGELETQVIYIYKNIATEHDIEYREFLLEDFRNQFGTRPLNECLLPEILQAIFGKQRGDQ